MGTFGEVVKSIIREEVVLEKFDGDDDDTKVLLERITLVNGVKTGHEFFEDGKLVVD